MSDSRGLGGITGLERQGDTTSGDKLLFCNLGEVLVGEIGLSISGE